jgi:hypothetical protein
MTLEKNRMSTQLNNYKLKALDLYFNEKKSIKEIAQQTEQGEVYIIACIYHYLMEAHSPQNNPDNNPSNNDPFEIL